MANTCGKAREFFGVIQRIYTIFANSIKRWQILKDNVTSLTHKSLSTTSCESLVDSVKAIRFHIKDIRKTLFQVAKSDKDARIQSEVRSLAKYELEEYEFLVAIVIWFEILFTVNLVSKKLQIKDTRLDIAIEEVNGLISYFESYRDTGLSKAIDLLKKLPLSWILIKCSLKNVKFVEKYNLMRTLVIMMLHFSTEESFKVNYLLYIIDQTLASLIERFEQYIAYEKNFGFLFTSDKLKYLDDKDLKLCCSHLESALKNNGQSDIDANELFLELKLLNNLLSHENIKVADVLNFLKQVNCFPNAIIAYKVLLTIPVIVVSAKRSFSKLKLLRSYLRSTMLQERINGLALIAISSNLLENVDYKELIDDFASKNVRRVAIFK